MDREHANVAVHSFSDWRHWFGDRWIPWWGIGLQTRRGGRRAVQRATKDAAIKSHSRGLASQRGAQDGIALEPTLPSVIDAIGAEGGSRNRTPIVAPSSPH